MSGRRAIRRTLAGGLLALLPLLVPSALQAQNPNKERGKSALTAFQIGQLDAVNLYNGNLTLTLPIGRPTFLGGGLSLQLSLQYNATVWDFETGTPTPQGFQTTDANPDPLHNAGLGWNLTMGRLYHPFFSPYNDSPNWMLLEPDGARRFFVPTLHDDDPIVTGVSYTRDGSYLRMKELAQGMREVESPDGTIRTFDSAGLLTRIRDRFDNDVNITYPDLSTWKLTDRFGRDQYVRYQLTGPTGSSQIHQVQLLTFQGLKTWTLDYTDTTIVRHRWDDDATNSATVTVPLLTRVTLPDGSSYGLSYYTDNQYVTNVGYQIPGALHSVTLPTLGRYDFVYQQYDFPQDGTGGLNDPPMINTTDGVYSKSSFDASGNLLGTWTYTQGGRPSGPFFSFDEVRTWVTNPQGDQTIHYFSIDIDRQKGLPISPLLTDDTGTRNLSTQVYRGPVSGGQLLRTTYLAYDADKGGGFKADQRVASQRTDYNDNPVAVGYRFRSMEYSSFDGLGHYRQMTTSGNFGANNVRSSFTDYNPTQGTYHWLSASQTYAPDHNFVMLSSGAPWVLGTYADQSVTENGVTAKSQLCFEASTGFLLRSRDYAGSAPGVHDVLAVFDHDALGQMTTERYFGGDVQTLSTSANLCGLGLPAAYYQLEHTYQDGVLATSRYRDPQTGALFPFYTLDQTIDPNSGLVASSRDSSGLRTDYLYDALGRITWERPQTGNRDGWTEYQYFRATSPSSLAKVFIHTHHNGSTGAPTLSESEVWFDALGRVWLEKTKMPDGSYPARETLYTGTGFKASVSEMGFPAKKTLYLNYDPFGRPGIIRPPDGSAHDVVFTYTGDWKTLRTTKVATGRDASGNPIEASSIHQEYKDGQGRLFKVIEPAGAGGASIATTYSYDIGNRLEQVSTTSGTVTQVRRFTYDHQGFLRSEQHPEKGPSGNGTVSSFTYDPRGHAGRTIDGPNDLLFTYDRAERLTAVRETATNNPLKEFIYASGNGVGDLANGKLKVARRYNHVVLGTTPITDTVEETYTYGGREGRVSSRMTQNLINGSPSDSFTQSFVYDELGDTSSLGYPQCTMCNLPAPRTVSMGYTHGFLTSVPGYATAITYHPNGLLDQVTHSNGIVDTQARDPNGIARPASFTTTKGTSTLFATGSYAYDGAGNIDQIGTSWFTYDKVDRVTTGTVFDGSTGGGGQHQQTYTYDAFGNLTAIGGSPGRSIPVNAATNRLTGATYDAAGNVTSWNGNTYQYDRFNQMWHMVSGSEDYIYLYTADDERLWSYQVGPSSINRWTIRDLGGQVLREYTFNRGSAVWTVDHDYVYRAGQLLAAETSFAGQRHYSLDHLGTPRLVTSPTGFQVAYHAYLPFGEEATYFLQDAERMKFTGHERDLASLSGTGDDLDYMHARHFNPMLGRFISVDPIVGSVAAPQSWNRYMYGLDNPLSYVDPLGLAAAQMATFNDSINVYARSPDPNEVTIPADHREFLLEELWRTNTLPQELRGKSLQQILASLPKRPCADTYACTILGSFHDDLPVVLTLEKAVVYSSLFFLGGELGAVFEEAAEGGVPLVEAPEEELFIPDEYYDARLRKPAPGQSSPYARYERFDAEGNIKQVTLYDRFGERLRQYDLGPTARHGEGYHTFEYDAVEPRQAPGGGRRFPHRPFQ